MEPEAPAVPVIPGMTVLSIDDSFMVEVLNPETGPGQPLFIPVLDRVEGRIAWPDMDLQARAAPLAALQDALSARYGPGQMTSGVGSAESPDNLFVGHFRWTLTR